MTRARDLGDFIADGAAAELVVDTTTLVVDSTNNRVGIGTASPSQALEVTGTAKLATVDINAGAIDGAVIGANSAAAVTATTLNASTKLQVNSTDVITNARKLSNIASIDATTAAAITAGGVGGGGAADFVASGTISNGSVVVLNANGTVSVTTQIVAGAGSFAQYSTSQYQSVGTFDSTNNKVVIAYNKHGDSFHADAVVGTVSGSSISFGSPVEFNANYTDNLTIGFDANAGKVLIAYKQSGDGKAIVGTVSGTSISFGTAVEFNSGGSATQPAPIVYDANAQKLVIFYRNDGNSNYGTAVVATISGTSVSFGTRVVFASNGITYPTGAAYHAAAQKVVCIYQDWGGSNNDFKPYGIVGTVSGTSISFGSAVVIGSGVGDEPSCAYDSVNQKIVASFYNDGGYK